MKIKNILIVIFILLLCSCSNIKNESIEGIIKDINIDNKANTYHTGYKYFLPSSLTETSYSLLNSIIESDYLKMYLYIDAVSYLNNTDMNYTINDDAYYSGKIDYDGKQGFIEINLKENNQYLIEIMFNYAKIEVMVDSKDINIALKYAVSILSSIEYNDNIIKNTLGDEASSYQEEVYNIFNTTSSDSNYLKRVKEDEEEAKKQEEVTDTDLLK